MREWGKNKKQESEGMERVGQGDRKSQGKDAAIVSQEAGFHQDLLKSL